MLYKDYFFKSSGELHEVEPIIISIFIWGKWGSDELNKVYLSFQN